MGVWWERMLAPNASLSAATVARQTPSAWWGASERRWADYRRAFGVVGWPNDPLNALHRLAFEHMFTPAWEANPDPVVPRLLGRHALRFALAAWHQRPHARPSRVVSLLQSELSRSTQGKRALILTDPGRPQRAQLLFPRRLVVNGSSALLDLEAPPDQRAVHRLAFDLSKETWTYRDDQGTRWVGGTGSGQMLLLPPRVLRQDPLPFVEPAAESQDDAPMSLAIVSGSASLSTPPDEAPWWLLARERRVLPTGYLIALKPGMSFTEVVEVCGPYEYCLLEAGRAMVWRGQGAGCDVIRMVRRGEQLRFMVQTEGARRWGAFELVQAQPQRDSCRSFRVLNAALPSRAALEVWADADASSFSVFNQGPLEVMAGVELEVGWPGQAQRRRLTPLTFAPGETCTFRPVRWQALALGPLAVERQTRRLFS